MGGVAAEAEAAGMSDIEKMIAAIIDPKAFDDPPQSAIWINREVIARRKARKIINLMRHPMSDKP